MAHRTLDKLAREREALLAVVAEVPEDELDVQHGDGWTVREILTHLLNAEEDHCKVIALIARGDAARLPADGFSLDAHNAERLQARGRLSKAELLEGLAAQRQRTEALFARLTDEQLELVGRHPALGEISVGKIFRIIGLHDKLHTQEIATALQR